MKSREKPGGVRGREICYRQNHAKFEDRVCPDFIEADYIKRMPQLYGDNCKELKKKNMRFRKWLLIEYFEDEDMDPRILQIYEKYSLPEMKNMI